MARRTSTHPVAVVVFLNAEGADPHDSVNVAEMAIEMTLGPGTQLTVPTRGGNRVVHVGASAELGRAARGGALLITAASNAFPS